MSLNIDDEVTSNGNGDKREQPRRDREERAPREERARQETGTSMRTMGRSLGRALSRTSTGEALTKAYNAFDKLLHDQNLTSANSADVVQLDQYKVTAFDNMEHRVDMASVLFSYAIKEGNASHVFYYTLLVEGSTPSLAPVRCDDRGKQFEIPRVAGDVMNERYADRVYDVMVGIYGDQVTLHDCGSNVLNADVDPEKDEQAIRNLAFYMNAAIETVSVEILGYQPKFTLAWLERDDSLEVNVDWSGTPQYSATGIPRRTDVKITITSNVRDESGSYRDQLSRVGGSLEMVYAPAAVGSDQGFGARRRTEETELFTPLFTITDLDTDFKAITLEMQLMGMASTAALSDDLYWVNSFRPVMNRDNERDYRDVGALNRLTAPGAKHFDVKSSSVDTQTFLEYFGTLCRRELAYAMDVEERGDNSWINGVFMEAAQGTESSLRRIFDAADNLTDGHFGSIYSDIVNETRSPMNPFEDGNNRIILGWYKEDGEKHDLRNFDLLHWLNRRGEHDPEMALRWQDTFDNVRDPIEVRIEQRLRMLEDVLGAGSFKVTGYAQQVLINSAFIAALAGAVKACDVRIDQGNTSSTYGNARVRGNFNISRLAGTNLGGGLFGRFSRRDDRDTRSGGRTFTGRDRRY
jgi:hypothetical protein